MIDLLINPFGLKFGLYSLKSAAIGMLGIGANDAAPLVIHAAQVLGAPRISLTIVLRKNFAFTHSPHFG